MFELHITCTKDIDKLSIDFSDGTSIVQESKPKESKNSAYKDINNDILFGDTNTYNRKSNKEVVKPLELPDIERPANVDDTLQNLEF